MLECLGDGECRGSSEFGGVLGSVSPAKDLADGLEVMLLEGSLRDKDERGGAVGEWRRVGSGYGAVFGLE